MRVFLRVLTAGLGALIATHAYATLGEKLGSSTATSQSKLVASVSSINKSAYTDNVTTLESDVVIHEYSRADGTVFAVAWQGPVMPDMQQLLGTYFSKFIGARANSSMPAGGLSQLNSTQSDLVVHSSGRLGRFNGLIYVPSLVPAGLDVEHLQ